MPSGTKLPRLAGLGDQVPSHRQRLVGVRAQFLAEPSELLVERLLEFRQLWPSTPPAPRCSDPNQASSKFFRL
jgi:hypothetical protein